VTGASVTPHYATLWEAIAERIPDSPALRHGARVVAWSEFEQRAARLAGGLGAHGIAHGDAVAAYLYNCPEYAELFFGALKLRAVPANVNYRYGAGELLMLLENSGARALVFDAALRDRVLAVADRARGVHLLVEVGTPEGDTLPAGVIGYEDLLTAAPAARIHRDPSDPFLSYTGGTTGLPKGVLMDVGLSIRNCTWFRDLFLGLPTEPLVAPVDFAVAHAGAPMTAIPASPLMHSTGFIFATLPTLAAGGTVTTLEQRSFDAHELFTTVERTGAQVIAIVGDAFALPMVRALDAGRVDAAHDDTAPYETSSVRVICSAGVAWSAQVKERMLEHMPEAMLFDACGASEGCSYGWRQIRRGDVAATANFDPAPGLKVLGPGGEELPPGEIGTLASPAAATGYFHDPDKTAATYVLLDGVQYAMPGDLGRIETDGTVTLIGRGVTTINTGGEKVYPGEVEEAIKGLAGVDDCLVLGIPDERFGQAVAALVVCRPGGAVSARDVVAAVRSALAPYKAPRHVRLVDAVPRAANGKVDYGAAAALAAPGEADA
jgi:fatty-acyl-CoA synthase